MQYRLLALVLCFWAVCSVEARAQNTQVKECSIALNGSVVNGSIYISGCSTIQQQQMGNLKQSLEEILKENQTSRKLSTENFRALLQALNTMIKTMNLLATNQTRGMQHIEQLLGDLLTKEATNSVSIESNNQSGGITGQNVTVNNSLQDRSQFSRQLRNFYAQGAFMRRMLESQDVTDKQIDEAESNTQVWINTTASWIANNMGADVREHFLNDSKSSKAPFYSLNGNHQPGEFDKRNNLLDNLGTFLGNLDEIIRSGAYDP